MKYSVKVEYPYEKMELSKKRMEAHAQFKYYDRVPINFCAVPRFFAHAFGIEYNEIFKDAETQYYWLLQFAKYHIENIPCDFCQEPVIHVHPYFDNVIQASAFGADIRWPYNQTPQAVPVLKDAAEIEKFVIPEPDAGLWGKVIDWWYKMREFAQDTEVIFNGQKGRVEVDPLTVNGMGPHMIAIDLAGTNFYWWMLEYPDECHNLMDKITKGIIQSEENARRIDPRFRGGYGMAEDSSTIMSAELFKEFAVPYDNILYERFGKGLASGRSMHMCGPSTHLHKVLMEDLKITSFDGFGYQVPPKIAAQNMGGRIHLAGNINPMLMRYGTKEEVRKEALEALEALAPCGGFMLFDGANVCPGTPLENLVVFTEAAEEYARIHPELFELK